MGYKLICIDMDGTLLNSKNEINEENLKTIKKVTEKGVQVAVCTGRLFASAAYFADLLGVDTPVIASNGAYVREKKIDKVIIKSSLRFESCMKIIEKLKKYNIYMHFNTYDSILTEKMSYSSEYYAKANETLPNNRKVNIKLVDNWEETFKEFQSEILKCIVIDDDISKLKRIREEMVCDEFEIVSSWKNNFEIMKKGVSKGKAVELLAKYYNVDRKDVMCIGDSHNDLSMIEFAGFGVAMGNADEYVKSKADYVTVTNDESGVSKAIEKFIL